MPPLRSRTVTHGRNMAGARALLRATGVASEDFGKPIIAVANSFTEFVPGHVHLADVGRVIQDAVKAALTEPWSNGQTEGQNTKLKLVKRQMYGRAGLDLLKARLLGAA